MLDATGNIWLAALLDFDFKIIYPGAHNWDAYALSRLPSTNDNFIETSLKDITRESVKAVWNSLIIQIPVLETMSMSESLFGDLYSG